MNVNIKRRLDALSRITLTNGASPNEVEIAQRKIKEIRQAERNKKEMLEKELEEQERREREEAIRRSKIDGPEALRKWYAQQNVQDAVDDFAVFNQGVYWHGKDKVRL